MSAKISPWTLAFAGFASVLVSALGGLYLYSRHDIVGRLKMVTGTEPEVWLVGLAGES